MWLRLCFVVLPHAVRLMNLGLKIHKKNNPHCNLQFSDLHALVVCIRGSAPCACVPGFLALHTSSSLAPSVYPHLSVRLWPQRAHVHFFLISIHQKVIYSGTLCVADLFVSMHGCVLYSVSFIAQQVGRVIKGCQWGI